MKLLPLPFETVALTGYTHKVILEYSDVAALAADTAALAIIPASGTFPAGMTCHRVALNLITAFDFSDADIVSLLAEVGDGGSTARLCAQTELAADGASVAFFAQESPYSYRVADSIDITFTAAGPVSPLLSTATSGKLEVLLCLVDANALETIS